MHFTFYLFMNKTAKQSLTSFICFSNIIAPTIMITNINIARPPLLSQDSMFVTAQAFNQDIGGWNVSSGIYFVSDFGLLQSPWSSYLFGIVLELGTMYLLLLFLKGCCFLVPCILYLIHCHDRHILVSHNSSVSPISSLLLLLSTTSILHDYYCFHRELCFMKRRVLINILESTYW